MDCTEVIEQLSEYLDPGARAELCREIEEHLSRCRHCRVEVDTVRKTIVLYQSDREIRIPYVATSKLEAALAKAYADPSGGSAD